MFHTVDHDKLHDLTHPNRRSSDSIASHLKGKAGIAHHQQHHNALGLYRTYFNITSGLGMKIIPQYNFGDYVDTAKLLCALWMIERDPHVARRSYVGPGLLRGSEYPDTEVLDLKYYTCNGSWDLLP